MEARAEAKTENVRFYSVVFSASLVLQSVMSKSEPEYLKRRRKKINQSQDSFPVPRRKTLTEKDGFGIEATFAFAVLVHLLRNESLALLFPVSFLLSLLM